MFVFIAQIILVVSLGGMLLIVVHKIPVLSTLSEVEIKPPKKKKKLVKKVTISKSISKQKNFYKPKNSKEGKKKRKKIKQEKKIDFSDDYWGKIRGG